MDRNKVKESLTFLSEKRGAAQDVPTEYQSHTMFREGFSVYRYSLIVPTFSFHVVYDPNDVLVVAIPTYE